MGLSTAERNKRKRERKKRAKEEERKRLEAEKQSASIQAEEVEDVEIEYVAEPLDDGSSTVDVEQDDHDPEDNDISAVLRRFQARASTNLVSDDDENGTNNEEDKAANDPADDDSDDDDDAEMSKRKLRELNRPSVAALKNKVERADLVEAHDVASRDPEFLLFLKAVAGTVSVPRHWGRKRKYLQGKVSDSKCAIARTLLIYVYLLII